MLEQCNNAEFVYSYFMARYCMRDFVFPGTQARFENIRREEGDPIYSVSGRITLNEIPYLVKIRIEQKTLKVNVDVYVTDALDKEEAARFQELLPQTARSLPMGFTVGLIENYMMFSSLIHGEQTKCTLSEMMAKLRSMLSASANCCERFSRREPTQSQPPTLGDMSNESRRDKDESTRQN